MNRDIALQRLADGKAELQRRFGVQFYLEDILGAQIDLVTDKARRAELRPFIEREAVHVRGAHAGVALPSPGHGRLWG